MKHLLYNMLAPLQRDHAIDAIRRMESRLSSPASRFAIPFCYQGTRGWFKTIAPKQNSDEIERFYAMVCELKPKRVLEIGTARGGSLYLWTQAATDDATLVSVDLPGGKYGGGYPHAKAPFYQSFAKPTQALHLMRADSHQPQTLGDVKSIFGDELIDFAFLDGDHSYEGVKADFEQYGPLVRPGGLIGFHDTLPREEEAEIHVDRFWRELCERYEQTTDLIGAEGTGRQIGIGVLRVPDEGLGIPLAD